MRALGWCVLLAGVLAWPAARLADALYGVDVTLLSGMRTAAERAAWLETRWHPEHGIAALYGNSASDGSVRVLLTDRSRLIEPVEAPTLLLLPLGPGDVAPLTSRTLRFRAAMVGLALGLLGALLLVRARRLAVEARMSATEL